jgi:hypothetical protein
VRRVGYEPARRKTEEIQNNSSASNPAAVFFARAKRQPDAPKPYRHIDPTSGDVVLHDIPDNADELWNVIGFVDTV